VSTTLATWTGLRPTLSYEAIPAGVIVSATWLARGKLQRESRAPMEMDAALDLRLVRTASGWAWSDGRP
jgi:predicted acyltransferase